MDYYVYILLCRDGSLYTGITTDPRRRLAEHLKKTKKCAKYTLSHTGVAYKALWKTQGRSAASKLEYRIKRLSKASKESLLSSPSALCSVVGDTDAFLYEYVAPDQI